MDNRGHTNKSRKKKKRVIMFQMRANLADDRTTNNLLIKSHMLKFCVVDLKTAHKLCQIICSLIVLRGSSNRVEGNIYV